MNTGFDKSSHKVDVHSIANVAGPTTFRTSAFFCGHSALTASRRHADARSQLSGRSGVLSLELPGDGHATLSCAVPQGEQISASATPVNVPDRLPRVALCADMQKGVGSSFYGEGASLALYLNSQLLIPIRFKWPILGATMAAGQMCPRLTVRTPRW